MSLYTRLRTAASRYYGCTPAAIDAQGRDGALLLSDVLQLIQLAASDPWQGQGLVEFVWPGAIARAEKRKQDEQNRRTNLGTMRMLVNMLKAKNPTDERTLNWIAAAEEELARNGS